MTQFQESCDILQLRADVYQENGVILIAPFNHLNKTGRKYN